MSARKGIFAGDDPFAIVRNWLAEAERSELNDPNAIALATVDDAGMPDVRMVLLKDIESSGDGQGAFVFYTNYDSAKGQDIADNPQAEVLFFWHEMQRQVRIRGKVAKVAAAKTDAYFHKRPRDSQLAAWVSKPQSGEVASRAVMEANFAELLERFPEGSDIPTPEFWGGYEISIHEIEFWQGRANRMHDRIVYTKDNGESWSTKRLLP